MDGERSTLGNYLDTFTRGFNQVYTAINPQKPANPNVRKPDITPWLIGGGVVAVLLVIVLAVTGRR